MATSMSSFGRPSAGYQAEWQALYDQWLDHFLNTPDGQAEVDHTFIGPDWAEALEAGYQGSPEEWTAHNLARSRAYHEQVQRHGWPF